MKAVRLIPGLRGLTYEQRLEKLKLNKVIDRRFRVDMIQIYKLSQTRMTPTGKHSFKWQRRGGLELKRGLKRFKKRSIRG